MTKSIVVKIDGREALPVRAIPFFFNWQEMTPDVLAKALCGKHKDWKISAYTLDNTEFHAVQKENWGFAKTEIDALEEILHDEAVTEENHAGYAQWQAQAPLKFPAGVFVWREALEEIFASINKNERTLKFLECAGHLESHYQEIYEGGEILPEHLPYLQHIPDLDLLNEPCCAYIPNEHPLLPGSIQYERLMEGFEVLTKSPFANTTDRLPAESATKFDDLPIEEEADATKIQQTDILTQSEIGGGSFAHEHQAHSSALGQNRDELQPAVIGVSQSAPKNTEDDPWLVRNPDDPEPAQPWYTPARYFARQLVREDATLALKRPILAGKVSCLMDKFGVRKRGGKHPFNSGTVLKAFSNVTFG